ncbi:hypothetical protein PsorP6_007209 [Peronosclerospora sorghi]|uniref:Uncharacterized protein n=1 Tax=Peronosclerospora sorghi TaxID=230839 RepID=A0ACC0WB84_9STRA|nr:hypothetical protein PsorP6_007209 [Peronosclerospora sorghi]
MSTPELYGSLHPGGAVTFSSLECAGIVAATFTSVFSYQALLVLVQLLYTQLGWSARKVSALKRLIQIRMTVSVLVGLLSDSYPIRGVRRKWYVVPGSILHVVAVFTLAGISAMHPRALPPRDALVVVALCVQTRVIEYSQRE